MAKQETITIYVSRNGSSRYGKDWTWPSNPSVKKDATILGAMRAYAKVHGAAGWMKANGSYLLMYLENGRIKQRTWRRARIGNIG